MTNTELRNKIKELRLANAEILDTIEKEQRKATNVEEIRLSGNKAEIENLEKELVIMEAAKPTKVGEDRSVKNFSLLRSIRDIAEGRSASDSLIAMNEMGRQEFQNAGVESRGQIILPGSFEHRAEIIAGTDANGKYAVAEEKFDLIAGLRANSILFKAGATLLNGLSGNVSIPVYGNSTAYWKGETTAAADAASTFSELTMQPRRITGYLDLSKQFLLQTSPAAAALLQSDLIGAVNTLLESTAFGTASGNTTQPAGLLNGVSYTSTGTTSWAKVVALESAVNTSNALSGKIGYVTTPSLKGVMKTTSKATNAAVFVMDQEYMNGYPVFTSSNVASGKIIFGDMSQILVGQWGGLDLLVDPYSQSIYGKVRIVINAYFDIIKRRTASFAYGNLS